MIPIVDGKLEQFSARGLYNGLVLMGDYTTNSYWDHITGECVHGEHLGKQLDFTDFDLLYTTVEGALTMRPDADYAVSNNMPLRGRFMKMIQPIIHKILGDRLPPHFVRTVGEADTRRTVMDLGLGIWTDNASRYYPLETLKAQSSGILDSIDGETVFVFYNQSTQSPDAFYIDAKNVTQDSDGYRFDNGVRFVKGQLCSATGEALSIKRPQQMFTRWYGFSYTFPNCEIYGDS